MYVIIVDAEQHMKICCSERHVASKCRFTVARSKFWLILRADYYKWVDIPLVGKGTMFCLLGLK